MKEMMKKIVTVLLVTHEQASARCARGPRALRMVLLLALTFGLALGAQAEDHDCITFSSKASFKLYTNTHLKPWTGNIYYSTNKTSWSVWSVSTDLTAAQDSSTGEYRLYLYGDDDNVEIATYITWVLEPTSGNTIACRGDIETLRGATATKPAGKAMAERCYEGMFQNCTALIEAPTLTATTLATDCYFHMFEGCTALTNAPALPAETLAEGCYMDMFKGCTALTNAPALPVETLAGSCYSGMFRGCTALTNAPALPAENLTNSCYANMFAGCTALANAPALPAKTLANNCYFHMFEGCTALTNAPTLPAKTLAQSCYDGMFNGCTALTNAPALPAENLADYCYMGMFQGCTSLTKVPALPATQLNDFCYFEMFKDCTSLVVNENPPGAKWSIPADAVDISGCGMEDMFHGTGGTFTGTPEVGKTYYVASDLEPVTFTPTAVDHTTVAVYTNGVAVAKTGDDYVILPNAPATVVYTVTDDDYLFPDGSKEKTFELDTSVNPATVVGGTPAAPVRVWFDEASVRFDTSYTTNARGDAIFFVTHPDQVLPVAYSTNNWGTATNAAGMVVGTQVSLLYQGPSYGPTTFIDSSTTNGLYNWKPDAGDYGRHNFGARSVSADATITNWLDGSILYTTNFNLAVTQSDGGAISAYTNEVAAGNDSWPLALIDKVTLVATPTDWTWQVEWLKTNGVEIGRAASPLAAVGGLGQTALPVTNSFTMPLCAVEVTGSFVVSDAYRADASNRIDQAYIATTNKVDSLPRLTDEEKQTYIDEAKTKRDGGVDEVYSPTKRTPTVVDTARDGATNDLALVESDAKAVNDAKPWDLIVASNMGENPLFTEIATNELGDVVSFVFEGKNYFVGTNAFTSFAVAFTNETFVPYATNLHVFGYQTITEEPPMVFDWTFDFVAYTDATGATNMPSVSIATIDEGEGFSRKLVNITNTLDEIVGDGVIVLSVTNGTPGAATYKQDLESLIGDENVFVYYTNFEPERKEEENPEKPGETVTSETLVVDDKSKVEEDGTIVLPGVDTDGKVTVEVKEETTNDVIVAGKLVSREWDVVIVNETTNTLTVGAVETGMNVLITNVTDTGKIVTLENVIAGKKIKIDNNGHLEATAHATDDIIIHNTSIHTLVGEYKAGGTIDILGEYGSLSNVVVDATGVLTLTGTNIVSGPVTLKSDASIVNDPTCSELDWSVAGDNHTTMIDWDWISGSTAFGVLVDADQTDSGVNGEYVLASNVTWTSGLNFKLSGGSIPVDTATLPVYADKASAEKTYIGAKGYRLYLVGDELVLEITWGQFNATFHYYEDLFAGEHPDFDATTTLVYRVDLGLTPPTFVGETYDLCDAWEGIATRTFLGWSLTNEWDDIYGDHIVWGASEYENGIAFGYYPTGLVTNIAPLTIGDKEYWARWTYVDTWKVGAGSADEVTATLNEATGELVLAAASAGAKMADGTDPGDEWETFAADTVLPWYSMVRSLVHTVRVSANVGKIGAYAFCNNSSLEEVFFEGGVPTCDDTAFQNCPFAVGYYPLALATSWSEALDAEGRFHGLKMYCLADVPTVAEDGCYVRMDVNGNAQLTVAPGITEVTVTSNPKGYLIVAPNGVTVKNAASVPQGRTEVKIAGLTVGGDKTVTLVITGTTAPIVKGAETLAGPWTEILPTSTTTDGDTTTVVFPSGAYRFFTAEPAPAP